MAEDKEHECSFSVQDIYELVSFSYVVVKLSCECGKERWDVGIPRD